MKNIVLIFSLLFIFSIANQATAQLSKDEKKEWKKKLKNLEPEQYKNLLDENSLLKDQNEEMSNQVDRLENQMSDKDAQISNYESQVASVRRELATAEDKLKDMSAEGSPVNDKVGVVFKVQIGAFTKKEDLSKYTSNSQTFNSEMFNEVQRFTLGTFKDYWEADTFKKYLRSMGVKDAWIVAYSDGKRVPLKDVLEGII